MKKDDLSLDIIYLFNIYYIPGIILDTFHKCTISLFLQKNTGRKLFLIPVFRWENQGSEKLGIFPKFSKLVSGRIRV